MGSKAATPALASGSSRGRTHSEEQLSILLALGGTAGSVAFFWLVPSFEPANGIVWTVPDWLAGAYLVLQIVCLLVSATQIRALGVVDSVVAVVPVVARFVMVAEWLLGHVRCRCSS